MITDPFYYSMATRIREPHLKRWLGSLHGKKLLDAGCGIGYFSRSFSRRGATVFGIDPDTDSIRFATGCNRGGNAHFIVADIGALPFKDDSFDAVLCSEVLEHVEADRRAVAEIARVGKPGAALVVTVPSPEGAFGSRIKRIAHDQEGSLERHYRDGYTISSLTRLLNGENIRICETRYSMIFLAELAMGLSKLGYAVRGGKTARQTDVCEMKKSPLLSLWKVLFPLILIACRIEDSLLGRTVKGHMILIRGVISKP